MVVYWRSLGEAGSVEPHFERARSGVLESGTDGMDVTPHRA